MVRCRRRVVNLEQRVEHSLSEGTRALVAAVRRFVGAELQPLESEVGANGYLDPERARALFERSASSGSTP